MIASGVKATPDIGALASRKDRELAVMIWNYHDDDLPGAPAEIDLSVTGLPPGRALMRHYRVDGAHSNSYSFGKRWALRKSRASSNTRTWNARASLPCSALRNGEWPARSRCRSSFAAASGRFTGDLELVTDAMAHCRGSQSAIAISYFDRQTLPVAIAAIQREIPISNTQFSQLQAAFLIAYAVMYAAGGKLIDALGTRRGFLLIMVGWSLACALHGFATSVGFLAMCRFLLGMGEGGGFPAATKAVAEWFSVRDRSTAMGMINAGTAVGAVAAPPLIALIIAGLNWRWVFALSGAAGLAWTFWWLREYYPPAAHPRLSEAERQDIREVLDPAGARGKAAEVAFIFRLSPGMGPGIR